MHFPAGRQFSTCSGELFERRFGHRIRWGAIRSDCVAARHIEGYATTSCIVQTGCWKQSTNPSGSFRYSWRIPYGALVGGSA